MLKSLNSLSQDSKKSVNDHAQNLIPINNLNPCEKAQENDLIMEKKTEKIFSDELYKEKADLEENGCEWTLREFETFLLDETPIRREIFFWSSVALYFLKASVLAKNENSRKNQKCNFWNILGRVPRIYRARVLTLLENNANESLAECGLLMSKTDREEYLKGSFMVTFAHMIESDNEEKVRILGLEYHPFLVNYLPDINDVKTACEIWDIDLDSICIVENPDSSSYDVFVKTGTKLWNYYSKAPVMDLRQVPGMTVSDYLKGMSVLIAPHDIMEKLFSLV